MSTEQQVSAPSALALSPMRSAVSDRPRALHSGPNTASLLGYLRSGARAQGGGQCRAPWMPLVHSSPNTTPPCMHGQGRQSACCSVVHVHAPRGSVCARMPPSLPFLHRRRPKRLQVGCERPRLLSVPNPHLYRERGRGLPILPSPVSSFPCTTPTLSASPQSSQRAAHCSK